MCRVRHLLLLCVASATLSYGADEALETKIKNRDARQGVLILRSKKLSPDFFPKSHALSTVNVNVSLIPNVSDVIATKEAKYTIKDYVFEAQIPFSRPSKGQAPAKFTIRLRIPDKTEKPSSSEFEAKEQIDPMRVASTPSGESQPPETNPSARAAPTTHASDTPRVPDIGTSPQSGNSSTSETVLSPNESLKLFFRVEQGLFGRLSIRLGADRKANVTGTVTNPGDQLPSRFQCKVDQLPRECRVSIPIDVGATIQFSDENGRELGSETILPPLLPVWAQIGLAAITGLIMMIGLAIGGRWGWRLWTEQGRAPPTSETVPRLPQGAWDGTTDKIVRELSKQDLPDIRRRLTKLEESVQSRPAAPAALPTSSNGDLEQLVQDLGLRARPATTFAKAGTPFSQEELLLAAINAWIESTSRDRDELVRLATGLNLQVRFCTHGDASIIVRDITNFVYPFETSDRDGGWLWLDLPTGESLSVPALINFFRVGKAPDLLGRLMEGMQGAPVQFQFRRFYRACRFKITPQGNGYTLLQQGQVLLESGILPSDWRQPPDYCFVFERVTNRVPGFSTRAKSPIPLLTDYLQDVQSKLDQLQNKFAAMATHSQGLSREPVSTEVVTQLKPLREDIDAVGRQVEKIAPPAPQSANPTIQLIALESKVKKLEGNVQLQIEDLASQIQALAKALNELGGTLAAPTEGVRAAASTPAQIVESPKVVAAAHSVVQSSAASGKPARIPDGWERSLFDARELSQLDAPYTDRVRNLSHVLARLPWETVPARLVHLLHRDGNFEIHEAEDLSPMTCQRCGDTDQRQFAVCLGERNCVQAGILLPLGSYHKGHYPAGYPALIDKCPEGEFQIDEVLVPARLSRATSTGLYNVAERMKLVVS